jgi:hypothetical protein
LVPKQFDSKIISFGQNHIKNNLDDRKLLVPKTYAYGNIPESLTEDMRQSNYKESIKTFGHWRLAPDEKGWYLATPQGGVVMDEKGNDLYFSAEEIQRIAIENDLKGAADKENFNSVYGSGMGL